MTKPKKPLPKNADEWSAFRRLLKRCARVPKAELDEKEAEYQKERAALKKAVG